MAIAFLLGACAASAPAPVLANHGRTKGGPAPVLASLERTECYGSCAAYVVSVHDDGTVEYEGRDYVKVPGAARGTIPPAAVAELRRAFEQAGFERMKDAYRHVNVTDSSSATVTFRYAGGTKRVEHYLGDTSAPPELTTLENEFDRIVAIERWIGTDKERQELGEQGWGKSSY